MIKTKVLNLTFENSIYKYFLLIKTNRDIKITYKAFLTFSATMIIMITF